MEKQELMQKLKEQNPGKWHIIDSLGKSGLFDLPQTDNTRTIPVNVYDAKVFITKIESQIEILEMVNKHDEAKHWKTLLESANELLKLNENL